MLFDLCNYLVLVVPSISIKIFHNSRNI